MNSHRMASGHSTHAATHVHSEVSSHRVGKGISFPRQVGLVTCTTRLVQTVMSVTRTSYGRKVCLGVLGTSPQRMGTCPRAHHRFVHVKHMRQSPPPSSQNKRVVVLKIGGVGWKHKRRSVAQTLPWNRPTCAGCMSKSRTGRFEPSGSGIIEVSVFDRRQNHFTHRGVELIPHATIDTVRQGRVGKRCHDLFH